MLAQYILFVSLLVFYIAFNIAVNKYVGFLWEKKLKFL